MPKSYILLLPKSSDIKKIIKLIINKFNNNNNY